MSSQKLDDRQLLVNKLICICKHCSRKQSEIRFMVKKIPLKVLVIYVLKLTVSHWQENNLQCIYMNMINIWEGRIYEMVPQTICRMSCLFYFWTKITESFCLLYSGHRRFRLEILGETVVYDIRVFCRLMTCVHGYK